MLKIRQNVFETNSSSMHSITIWKNYKPVRFKFTTIPVQCDLIIDKYYYQEFDSNGMNDTEWTKFNCLIDLILGSIYKTGFDYELCQKYLDILGRVVFDKKDTTIKYNFDCRRLNPDKTDTTGKDIFIILNFSVKDEDKDVYNIFKKVVFDDEICIEHSDFHMD